MMITVASSELSTNETTLSAGPHYPVVWNLAMSCFLPESISFISSRIIMVVRMEECGWFIAKKDTEIV